MSFEWPDIPYAPWRDTCSALHLYSQIVGKYRLARTPWINHSWHATLYVNARGLTTSLVPDGPGGVEICFDLVDHRVIGSATDGRTAQFPLAPMSVAEFHRRFRDLIGSLGGTPEFDGRPNEVPNPIPFVDDRAERPYAADAVTRFFRALVAVDQVLKRFRTGYLGKVSPVHLFWGSFDLAVTRFSGRRAPRHPGGIPALPGRGHARGIQPRGLVGGFLAGRRRRRFSRRSIPTPIRPPEGFADARPGPEAAYFDKRLGEFLLPYDAVRRSSAPEATLMSFLSSTYQAAADLGGWDRAALECPLGRAGQAAAGVTDDALRTSPEWMARRRHWPSTSAPQCAAASIT